jgi:hypothetical protein
MLDYAAKYSNWRPITAGSTCRPFLATSPSLINMTLQMVIALAYIDVEILTHFSAINGITYMKVIQTQCNIIRSHP